MEHSGVLYISGRQQGPQALGARGSLPHPTLSTGLHRVQNFVANGPRLAKL